MKLLQVALVGTVALCGVGFLGTPAKADPKKEVICHIPPGNPDAAHTIIVGKAAVPAHLAHGDFRDECDFGENGSDGPLESMVTICHIPPGNPANAHTITVGAPAVPHHVTNHGDTLGPCGDDGGDDGPTD